MYGYFSSKGGDSAGPGRILLCRENERIRVLFADCCTLAGLEERAVAYLQDIAANRMGDYKMIAQALGTPGKCESVPACADELRTSCARCSYACRLRGDRPRGKSGILLHRDLFRRCRRPDRAVLYRGEKAQRRHTHAESAHDAAQNDKQNKKWAQHAFRRTACCALICFRQERTGLVARYLQMCYTTIWLYQFLGALNFSRLYRKEKYSGQQKKWNDRNEILRVEYTAARWSIRASARMRT